MATREIIRIDEEKCNGCGECVVACAEGAIDIVDGKARLVSEVYCDGLGACLGKCPEDALTIERREAVAFDEAAVQDRLKAQGVRREGREALPMYIAPAQGCPSSQVRAFGPVEARPAPTGGPADAALGHWPIKLRLVPPGAPFLADADLALIADCVPFAFADLHRTYLPEHALVIGCPKFEDPAFALERLTEILRDSGVRSLTVVHMEVPCCFGYWQLGRQALAASGRTIPLNQVVIGVRGDVRMEKSSDQGDSHA